MAGYDAPVPVRDEWLSLGEAAEFFGVHPATLRLWADQGEIPSHRTPGGHRRFRRLDLETRLATESSQRAGVEDELVVHSAMGRARLDVSHGRLAAEPWYDHLDEMGRKQHRELGRKVAESLLRYLAGEDPSRLDEARLVGREYGQASQQWNIGLTDAVRAYLYFRDNLTDSAMRMLSAGSVRTSMEWIERFKRVNQFTNEVLLSLVATYEERENVGA